MGEYQEEVLINLLDLQAELRGDESEEADADGQSAAEASAGSAAQEETLAVTDGGLTVAVLSPADEAAAHDRLVVLSERVAKLESRLAGVAERIDRIERGPDAHASSPETDRDVASGSFLDLQKIVADRLKSR